MKPLTTTLVALLLTLTLHSQHTFSIVAVDTATGEVGGAGATCYATVNDIADVHPGVGFIHTQSYVNTNNQVNARVMMNLGYSPQQIMDSLQANDDEGNATIRQYAAVDLVDGGRAAAFTGQNCFDYKGQRVGPNYAIAGNILLGPEILDSMEARFLNTVGSLEEKLIAALQGAKVPGADTRCAADGVSSLSAYIIVAKPNDIGPNYYLNLNVENVLPQDPINVLQNEFDAWQTTGYKEPARNQQIEIYPNPSSNQITIRLKAPSTEDATINIYSTTGQLVKSETIPTNQLQLQINTTALAKGLYTLQSNNTTSQFVIQ